MAAGRAGSPGGGGRAGGGQDAAGARGGGRLTHAGGVEVQRPRRRRVPYGVVALVAVNEGKAALVTGGDSGIGRAVAVLFEREGAEAWHTTDVAALLPENAKCAHCGGTEFRKETDILDVWFDSGSTHSYVVEARYGEGVRADVDFGPTLMLNRNRCILCTRCVRFMKEIDGDAQIGRDR